MAFEWEVCCRGKMAGPVAPGEGPAVNGSRWAQGRAMGTRLFVGPWRENELLLAWG